ncbi:MAG: substrate-binding domain-containing protein, partial [Cyanobacteria bacterium J06573_2]
MWHKEKNTNPIVRLVLLLALASTPMMTNLFKSDYVLAQSPTETPSFPLPTAVPNGTKIKVDGSTSMTRANEALKERFEKEYSGTNVELATNGTDEALKALKERTIDIAAIGRGLSPEQLEKLGFEQQRLRREKIAIVVGKDNPFKRDLDNRLFTKIYTGEITNWSEVGGPDKEIRVIDRPDFSDTREAFKNYPLFRGRFKTGSTATQLDSDDPAEVIKQLGDDGIGFVLANQVENLGDEVRILSMHKTLPDDSRYPYSQPLVYVYRENPSEAVQNFVGFATAEPGREALQVARKAESVAVAAAVSQALSGNAPNATATPGATTEETPGATPGATPGVNADGTAAGSGNETANNANGANGAANPEVGAATNTSASDGGNTTALLPDNTGISAETGEGTIPWWWILLPAAVIGALALWWLLGRRKSQEDDTVARGVLPEDSPPPFTPTSTNTGPVKEPEPVANTSVEANAGINTAAEPPNTAAGINTAGIAAGIAGLGAVGAAALSSKDNNEDEPETRNNLDLAETSPELRLDTVDSEQPNISGTGLDIEAPDLEQPDIPDTSLDLEAPAAVVSSSYPSLPRINTPLDDVEAPPTTEPVVSDTPSENNLDSNTVPQEELPSASTSNFLGNFALGTGVAGAAAAAGAGAQRIKSQFAGKKEAPETPQSTEDESEQIQGTVSYPQLPDVWDSTQTGEANSGSDSLNEENSNTENDLTSPSSLWGTPQTEQPSTQEEELSFNLGSTPNSDSSLLNREEENTENNDVTSPSSLWGTPQTEEPSTDQEEEKSSFSLGGAAAGAGLAAGAAAIGSKFFNRDNADTSEDSDKTEETQDVEQQSTAETQNNESGNTGLGSGWFLNRFRKNTSDATDTDATDTAQTSEVAEIPDLPEVSITNQDQQLAETQTEAPQEQPANDGLPNVWVTQANQQPATPEETISQEEIAQFGVSSTAESEDTSAPATGAVLAGGAAVGAFALGSQINTNNDEQTQEQDSETSAAQVSFSEDVALDEVANQAEIDTMIRTSNQDSDQGDTDWDKIYGIHNNGATVVPGESNILLANRTPKWAYASWNIAAADREAMKERGAAQLVLRLYDTTDIDLSYQNAKLVQQYECEETVNHRYVAIPNPDRDYITEIGYLTQDKEWLLVSRSPVIRVFSRPHKDFWFEADAELIIHGATEPGSTVTIDGHKIKVKQD